MLAALKRQTMGIGVAFGLNRTYQRALDKYLQDNQPLLTKDWQILCFKVMQAFSL